MEFGFNVEEAMECLKKTKKIEEGAPVEGKEVITLTWGDQAENGVGMEQLGKLRPEGSGFSIGELEALASQFDVAGELYRLCEPDVEGEANSGLEAAVLVIRGGVDLLCEKGTEASMFAEQKALQYDKRKLMRGRVVNSKARWNLCMDENGHEADIEGGKGTVIGYDAVPVTMSLVGQFGKVFGDKVIGLKGEGNYYYNIDKCGIGFHGDAERRIVVAVRLGASMPLYYQWYRQSKPIGDRVEIPLNGGDIYIMSEKAVGTDWKKKKVATLRHATGAAEYVTVKA